METQPLRTLEARLASGVRDFSWRGPVRGGLPRNMLGLNKQQDTVDGCEILHQLIDGLSHYL